jgi:hypothetical protein
MTLDYTVAGKVQIIMKDYIQNMLDELPTDMNGVANSPAADHLFKVNTTDPTKLSEEESIFFHIIQPSYFSYGNMLGQTSRLQ